MKNSPITTSGSHQNTSASIAKLTLEGNPRPTQSQRILAYLEQGKTLTALGALRLFGCFSLAQRIHELRGKGYRITSAIIKVSGGKRVAKYKLETSEGEQ
jgi:hypothetical protein